MGDYVRTMARGARDPLEPRGPEGSGGGGGACGGGAEQIYADWNQPPASAAAATGAAAAATKGAGYEKPAAGDKDKSAEPSAFQPREASVLVPIGGLRMVRGLAGLARGRLLVLAGDKGYNRTQELAGLRDPHMAVHGSFSFMVNFHAAMLYVLRKGGFRRVFQRSRRLQMESDFAPGGVS